MKVLYLLHTSGMDGSTISILNLLTNINKTVIPIVVIPKGKNDKLVNLLKQLKIKYYQCLRAPFSAIPQEYSLFQKLIYLIKLYIKKIIYVITILWIVKKEKPNVIHSNVGVLYEGFRIAKFLNIPHVWHLREYQDRDFNLNFLYGKKYFEKMLTSSYVICITNDIKEYFNLKSPKTTTIYNGIYKKEHIALESKEKYFLCASRITPSKKLEDAIKAFASFDANQKDKWELIIAGNGEEEYTNYLKNLSYKLKCQSNIKFVGLQSSDSVFLLMKKAAALIVASQNEGFGRMTAEACFAGTMVIGRNTGGTREILDKINACAFYTIPELVEKLYEISEAVNTDAYITRIKHSQFIAQQLYSIEQNVNNTFNFYKYIKQST